MGYVRSLVALVVLVNSTAGVSAAAGTTAVITVHDAKNHALLADASVTITGGTFIATTTDDAGRVVLDGVLPGTYDVTSWKVNYAPRVDRFVVTGSAPVHLVVQLVPRLKQVAAVRAASTNPLAGVVVGGTPAQRIASTLSDALNRSIGTDILTANNDPNSPVTVSLHGHGTEQTAVMLDGVPLSPPGQTADLRTIGTGLFTSANVSFAPTPLGAAGSVNFHAPAPTADLQHLDMASAGSYSAFGNRYQVTGTSGNVGVVLELNALSQQSPVNSAARAHDGAALLSLHDVISPKLSVTGLALNRTAGADPICAVVTTIQPCGLGLGSPANAQFRLYTFGADMQMGAIAGNVKLFRTQNTQSSFSTFTTGGGGYSFGFALPAGPHTFSLNGVSYHFDETLATGSQSLQTAGGSYASLAFDDAFRLSGKFTVGAGINVVQQPGAASESAANMAIFWRPAQSDSLTVTASSGGIQPSQKGVTAFTDPSQAAYNCGAGNVLAGGPAQAPGKPVQQGITLQVEHSTQKATYDFYAYDQVARDQILSTSIAASSEPPGFFPPGYLASLNSAWHAPGVCGSAAFAPNGIFVNQQVAGTTQLFRGMDFSAHTSVGHNSQLYGSYSITDVLLLSAPQLGGSVSTTVSGGQLPGIPRQRASLALDTLDNHSGIDLVGDLEYVSSGNAQHLPSYTTANFGVEKRFGNGALTLTATNLFNAFAGTFANNANAVPVALSNGSSLLLPARPNLPPSFQLSYTLGTKVPQIDLEAQVAAAAAPPKERAGGGDQHLKEPPTGANILAIRNDDPACSGDIRTAYTRALSEIDEYRTAFEHGTTLPSFPDLTLVPHRQSDGSYWLEIEYGKSYAPIRNFVQACVYITILDYADAQARKLGISPNFGQSYSPSIGVYVVLPRTLKRGGGSIG
ncbi:MAG TPA: TonB-dependent receptor [Candidatus Rubrimentiphilum sp.]|nr:TonB-dependent receptor [Candidatus Rubrimentiphilum sp.]